MREPFEDGGESKADIVADAVNRLLFKLSGRAAGSGATAPPYEVTVIGCGGTVRTAMGGALTGRYLVPNRTLTTGAPSVEERRRKVPNAQGELVEQTIDLPVWVRPRAARERPMTQALQLVHSILAPWIGAHPRAFPPIVLNIMSGAASDRDPRSAAAALRALGTDDGNLLLFNVYIPKRVGTSVLYPEDDAALRDATARDLFAMSSLLPSTFRNGLLDRGIPVGSQARGFIQTDSIVEIIQFLETVV
jgi:hypothetical protein